MDPYLEEAKLWPVFHHQFITCLYQILLPGLVDRYRARVAQRHYVTEQALFTSVVREEHTEEFIEVRQRHDNRFVTLIEAVSPANKVLAKGRQVYLDKRRDAKAEQANVVEIDLVLQGQPTLDNARDGLPECAYAVTVARAAHHERYEIYATTLQKRLPRFKLPLAADDRDTVLDLQAAFSRCYDQGGLAGMIDYRRDPALALKEEDRTWLADWLKQQKLR